MSFWFLHTLIVFALVEDECDSSHGARESVALPIHIFEIIDEFAQKVYYTWVNIALTSSNTQKV